MPELLSPTPASEFGINFGKTHDLRADLEMWLRSVQCRQVTVAFDAEDKTGKPMVERHDAQIWARYLACSLAQTLGVKARVLVLPPTWRDAKGKADWDGALALMLKNDRSPAEVRQEFERVLDHESIEVGDLRQFKLFDQEDEDYIRKEVERKLYQPQLPNGGDQERAIVEKLSVLATEPNFADAWRAKLVLPKWQAVLPTDPRNAGYYYTRTPMSRKSAAEDYDWLVRRRTEAVRDRRWDREWFYTLLLDGTPTRVADFEMRCRFLLQRADGAVDRLVELHNVVGESVGPVNLDAEAFHAPQKFRKRCLAHGNFNWDAGEKDLAKLHGDIARQAAWRVIHQVVSLGWRPLRTRRTADLRVECDGIWFLGDCARANVGEVEEWLTPDEDGIYWLRQQQPNGDWLEEGFQMSDTGAEGSINVPFYQGKPLLHPEVRVGSLPLELPAMPELGFAGRSLKSEARSEKSEGGSEMANSSLLILLCQLESLGFGGDLVPQQAQEPSHLTNHGCIAWSVRSHVSPEVFFEALERE